MRLFQVGKAPPTWHRKFLIHDGVALLVEEVVLARGPTRRPVRSLLPCRLSLSREISLKHRHHMPQVAVLRFTRGRDAIRLVG